MTVQLSTYQRSVAFYWNREANPVNHRLAEIDGLFHHHYGLGDPDPGVDATDEDAVAAELHRLESAQADYLIDHLTPLHRNEAATIGLDAGCGRGGTAIMAHLRTRARIHGLTLSQQQADDANQATRERGVGDFVHFQVANMLAAPFEDGAFDAAWNNESTMYADLDDLYGEISRLLKPGGRYVTITGCANDTYGLPSPEVNLINAHYGCNIHTRSRYLRAMLANRLVPTDVIDLTEPALPYWRLRAGSTLATGIEQHFLTAYEDKAFQYMLIAADRV